MNATARLDRLYQLLPPVYRDRDAAEAYPLRDLLRVMTEQVLVVEDAVGQLYEDWFIETCADWVVPYLGDLVGYHPVRELGETGASATPAARALAAVLAPRREVANTVRFRRRKGTLGVLEDLARAITGWPARASEFTPAAAPYAVDVHLRLWRLRAFSVTRTRGYIVTGEQSCYRFSVLGNDAPLFNRPAGPDEAPLDHDARLRVPEPLRRNTLRERIEKPDGGKGYAVPEKYYGEGKTLAVYAQDWPYPGAPQLIPRERIVSCNLSHWKEPDEGILYIDPVLGRLRFPCDDQPRQLRLTYHYGAPTALGGGEYPRELTQPAGTVYYTVEKGAKISEALARWTDENPAHAVIEIEASGYYFAVLDVKIPAGHSLQIRAASGRRPVLAPDTTDDNAPGAFTVTGGPGSRFMIDGLLLVGAPLRINGPRDSSDDDGDNSDQSPAENTSPWPDVTTVRPCPFEVVIRHCTLVPGLSFDHECHDQREHGHCGMKHCERASLELLNVDGCVRVEHSILGTILVEQDVVNTEPLPIEIHDSIVDCSHRERVAEDEKGKAYESHHAIFARHGGNIAHAVLRLARCTIFGWVKTHAIRAADECIFTDRLRVARRQLGCMRFCWVPARSRTPRRYRCQPDLALQAATAKKGAALTDAEAVAVETAVEPVFMSRDFGHPDYARLANDCPVEIRTGAEDESEIGVFHDLYDPQRTENLKARVAEFLPFNSDGVYDFVT